MVRAILEGRKTQMRRIIKDGMDSIDIIGAKHIRDNLWNPIYQPALADGGRIEHKPQLKSWFVKSPYQIGNKLWVREKYRVCNRDFDRQQSVMVHYYSDRSYISIHLTDIEWGKWTHREKPFEETPCRFMYKSLARLWLEVTGIRVERLQDMSYSDWLADFCPTSQEQHQALQTFAGMSNQKKIAGVFWDSLNAKRGFSWENNPFVWVIEFKKFQLSSIP